MAALKLCSVEGCGKPFQSRGLCSTHYKQWHRVTANKPVAKPARELILDSLPGTRYQIAAKSGLCYDTVMRLIPELRAARLVHVDHFVPPADSGARWIEYFAAGDEDDATLSRLDRKKARNAKARAQHHIRKLVRTPNSWLGPLMGAA